MSIHLKPIINIIKQIPSMDSIEFSDDNVGVWILGAGKASVAMAVELIKRLPIAPYDGIIISPIERKIKNIQVFKVTHPYPSSQNVAASYELLEVAKSIPKGDTVFFCLSGGASSLLLIPPYGVEIEDVEITFKLLLESGAAIKEINAVRKHLCELKGGKLGQSLSHTNLTTLIISDVPGNDITTIGSGPTVGDNTSYKDAELVLNKYGLWSKIPLSVQLYIQENIAPESVLFETHTTKIVSSAEILAEQVLEYLKLHGYDTWVAPKAYSDNVRHIAKIISAKAISVLSKNYPVNKPATLVFYGESYVDVKGQGRVGEIKNWPYCVHFL
jgi:glycerate-2-kinase